MKLKWTMRLRILILCLECTLAGLLLQIWLFQSSSSKLIYTQAKSESYRSISGDVWELDEAQRKAIDDGIAFYKNIAPVIKNGQTYRFGEQVKCIRHPEGWLEAIAEIYCDEEKEVTVAGRTLTIKGMREAEAVAVRLK